MKSAMGRTSKAGGRPDPRGVARARQAARPAPRGGWPTRPAVLALGLLTIGAILGRGASAEDHDAARELRQQGLILPLEEIIATLPYPQPLRILEVELEREHGIHVYELEVLDAHGRVWEVELDAISGKLLESEEED